VSRCIRPQPAARASTCPASSRALPPHSQVCERSSRVNSAASAPQQACSCNVCEPTESAVITTATMAAALSPKACTCGWVLQMSTVSQGHSQQVTPQQEQTHRLTSKPHGQPTHRDASTGVDTRAITRQLALPQHRARLATTPVAHIKPA
jgi:hypothetical protein